MYIQYMNRQIDRQIDDTHVHDAIGYVESKKEKKKERKKDT